MNNPADLPRFNDWNAAAVRLLQGVVYYDETTAWNLVLSSRSSLESFFAHLGLLLVVDESEGIAYVRQLADDEMPDGYEKIPKLFRRTALGFDATLLCVLLRDELRRFEEEEVHDERCVIEKAVLFDTWKSLVRARHDEVRQHREFSAALSKLEELKFVRQFSDEPEAWEIRRILKVRLPLAELENLRHKLIAALGQPEASLAEIEDE